MAAHLEHFKASKERALTAIDWLIAKADTEARKTTNEGIKATLLGFFAAADRSVALGLKNQAEAASEISNRDVRPARMKIVDAVVKRVETNLRDLEAAKLNAAETAHGASSILTIGQLLVC